MHLGHTHIQAKSFQHKGEPKMKAKTLFLFSFLFLFLPLVQTTNFETIFAGENITQHFDYCENLTIEIIPCEENEWFAFPNCTETSTGYFECNCTDNWNVYLKPAINSVGSFNITFINYYTRYTSTGHHRSSSGKETTEIIYKNTTTLIHEYMENEKKMKEFYEKIEDNKELITNLTKTIFSQSEQIRAMNKSLKRLIIIFLFIGTIIGAVITGVIIGLVLRSEKIKSFFKQFRVEVVKPKKKEDKVNYKFKPTNK